MQQALKTGLGIAAAAAALFALSGPVTVATAADAAGVKCVGGNGCKGKSECKTAKNECKGQNGCKGQGTTEVKSEKDCTDKGGKVVAAK